MLSSQLYLNAGGSVGLMGKIATTVRWRGVTRETSCKERLVSSCFSTFDLHITAHLLPAYLVATSRLSEFGISAAT